MSSTQDEIKAKIAELLKIQGEINALFTKLSTPPPPTVTVNGVPEATAKPVAVLYPPAPPPPLLPPAYPPPPPPPPATTRYSTAVTVGITGVTELLAELAALVPIALVAVTVKV